MTIHQERNLCDREIQGLGECLRSENFEYVVERSHHVVGQNMGQSRYLDRLENYKHIALHTFGIAELPLCR
jgi:hypothetical protein